MKISEDFNVASLLKGFLLNLLGLTFLISSLYVGFNGGEVTVWGFFLFGGLIAFGLGGWMVCRLFRQM
jgi:hypothetical protein